MSRIPAEKERKKKKERKRKRFLLLSACCLRFLSRYILGGIPFFSLPFHSSLPFLVFHHLFLYMDGPVLFSSLFFSSFVDPARM